MRSTSCFQEAIKRADQNETRKHGMSGLGPRDTKVRREVGGWVAVHQVSWFAAPEAELLHRLLVSNHSAQGELKMEHGRWRMQDGGCMNITLN